jgi:alpha-glucosidase
VLLDQPHHDGSAQYVENHDPGPDDVVPVRVFVPPAPDGGPGADQVFLRVVRDGEPALSPALVERTQAAGTWWRAELQAHNPVNSYRFLLGRPDGGIGWLSGTGLHHRQVSDAADFRIVTHPGPPDWVQDQVMYQVFPDRFARSATGTGPPAWALPADWDDPVVHRGPDTAHQFYGGDLDGVAEHLDHLTGLGATVLYLTPVFEAPSNHRYDAVSFDHVDPLLGGTGALERLIAGAHRRGLRVLGDLTTNHTGREHEWFRAAVADPGRPEGGFYRFGWHPDDYESWLGHRSLPKLDHANYLLRERMYEGPDSVVAHWLRCGLDGWRIDVANMTGRMGGEDLAHEVARAVRRTAGTAKPDAWILAEHGFDASADLTGEPHHLVYHGLPVPLPVLPGTAMVATMRELHAAMPWSSWAASTSLLDSHDTPRFRTVVGGGTGGGIDSAGRGRDRHVAGLGLQMTLPGVPSVFMGDEIGLTGVDGEHSRTPFPWRHRDAWEQQTLAAYRAWIALRHNHVALRRGGLRWVQAGEHSVTFLREHPAERILVHVARGPHRSVELPLRALGLDDVAQVLTLRGEPAEQVRDRLSLPGSGPAAHAYQLPD